MCIQITSFGELVAPRNSCNSYGFFCRVQAAHNNNTNLFNFKKEPASVDDFIAFISKNYKNNDLLKMVVSMEKRLENKARDDEVLLTTMRMSVVGGK